MSLIRSHETGASTAVVGLTVSPPFRGETDETPASLGPENQNETPTYTCPLERLKETTVAEPDKPRFRQVEANG